MMMVIITMIVLKRPSTRERSQYSLTLGGFVLAVVATATAAGLLLLLLLLVVVAATITLITCGSM